MVHEIGILHPVHIGIEVHCIFEMHEFVEVFLKMWCGCIGQVRKQGVTLAHEFVHKCKNYLTERYGILTLLFLFDISPFSQILSQIKFYDVPLYFISLLTIMDTPKCILTIALVRTESIFRLNDYFVSERVFLEE